jgi:hypothetical protein
MNLFRFSKKDFSSLKELYFLQKSIRFLAKMSGKWYLLLKVAHAADLSIRNGFFENIGLWGQSISQQNFTS